MLLHKRSVLYLFVIKLLYVCVCVCVFVCVLDNNHVNITHAYKHG